jgi:hypothetical protein
MGILDRLMGSGAQRPAPEPQGAELSPDEQAIARYRYLLRTAPPETIEQAHADAFAQLTPEQRRRVLLDLSAGLPEHERASAQRVGDDPAAIARVATRAEVRQPGSIERAFGGFSAAPASGGGLGGLMAGSFLSSMAGTVLGSMIAQHFFAHHPEANQLFGNDAGTLGGDSNLLDQNSAGGPIQDPFRTADVGGAGDDLSRNFDNGGDDLGGFDPDGFDPGDSFDV